jgi:pantoate--beta-alanine ligase
MVRTRGFRIEILPVPVERAPSGLALSSRNAYLTAEERRIAPELYRTLFSVAERVLDKRTTVPRETSHAVALLAQAGFDSVDYVAVCDAETLAPLEEVTRPARVLGAARLGRTRLIDNVPVLIPGR